jgi:acyl-[acyl-carrier-protein]-phospholipid O-acyltransferase/long-chain-fatty-acid--[acyl-carrier-protein] ligase
MGFVYLKGRLKRFAKIGGEMVSLPSLENLVKKAYPDLEFECTDVAIPHDTKGEQIILVTTSKKITSEHLTPFIKQQGYTELYLPKSIVYRDELPILGSGKRDFVTLKKEIEEEFAKK